jgi:hypothetical protein
MDTDNNAIVSKSRCPELSGKVIAKPGAQVAKVLKTWLGGVPAAQPQRQNAPQPTQTAQATIEGNNGDGDALFGATPYYVRDWQQLTGAAYDFVKEIAALHRAAESGPASDMQYKYLVGLIDGLTNKQHGYVLSLLCQSEINKANVPGAKVAARLFDILPEMIKMKDEHGKVVNGDDGKPLMILNPNYRQDICEMLGKLAQTPATVEA